MPRLLRGGQVQRQEVGLREKLLETDQADAMLDRKGAIGVRLVGQQRHAEAGAVQRHRLADPPKSRYAEGPPTQRQIDPARPPQRTSLRMLTDEVLGERQDQRKRVLGDRVLIGPRRESDGDAPFRRRCQIDGIVADACTGNDAKQRMRTQNRRCIRLPPRDDRLDPRQTRIYLRLVELSSFIRKYQLKSCPTQDINKLRLDAGQLLARSTLCPFSPLPFV